jgi:hypothetical protein
MTIFVPVHDRDEQVAFARAHSPNPQRESAAGKLTYAELEENDDDLKKLRTWLEEIRKLDFHGASLANKAAERFAQCEALLDSYARQVFDAQDGNLPPARTGKPT